MTILAASFLPLIAVPDSQRFGAIPAIAALLLSAALLAIGSAAVFPFEMDTVVALAGRLVATHYGLYNTLTKTGTAETPPATTRPRRRRRRPRSFSPQQWPLKT